MRAGIAILQNNVNNSNSTFTNVDATFHVKLTLRENKNTITYINMDAANNTEIMF